MRRGKEEKRMALENKRGADSAKSRPGSGRHGKQTMKLHFILVSLETSIIEHSSYVKQNHKQYLKSGPKAVFTGFEQLLNCS